MSAKEKALIQACLQNDEQAQTALYERYKGQMYVVCLRYARSVAEAEDFLVEEAKGLGLLQPDNRASTPTTFIFKGFLAKVMLRLY